ncbi:MAG: ferritin-like domain-containing protein [Candidatus Dormibacteraeota bacterium]|nr:ferritin-like domain-containing protein [Candidatus Dormibacteraeota bacterium]
MSFDIERYKDRSKKIDLSDIRWDQVKDNELPQSAIDSMFYMMDIEIHTVIYLSELLVSKACMDPVITSFLSCWAYEEMYHGEAFAKFLNEYGVPVSPDRPQEIRLREGFGRVNAVMAIMFGSYLIPFFPALYLTVGAVNELTTVTGYTLLRQRANHPVLDTILERIIKQEQTHYAFYRSQAEKLLRESAAARGATRWFLLKRFKAVGEGTKTVDEVNKLAMDLFSGPDGRRAVRDIDAQIEQLPGLHGVGVMERVLDRAYQLTGAPELSPDLAPPPDIELGVPVGA